MLFVIYWQRKLYNGRVYYKQEKTISDHKATYCHCHCTLTIYSTLFGDNIDMRVMVISGDIKANMMRASEQQRYQNCCKVKPSS